MVENGSEAASRCDRWFREQMLKRDAALDRKREKRFNNVLRLRDRIVKLLKADGWKKELQFLGPVGLEQMAKNPIVRRSSELTSFGYTQVACVLDKFLNETRTKRIWRERLHKLEAAIIEHYVELPRTPEMDYRPAYIEFALLKDCRALVDAPHSQSVCFYCESTPMRFPAILAHPCAYKPRTDRVMDYRRDDLYVNNAVILHVTKTSEWKHARFPFQFDFVIDSLRSRLRKACDVLRAMGYDPRRTTWQEIESSKVRLDCVDCRRLHCTPEEHVLETAVEHSLLTLRKGREHRTWACLDEDELPIPDPMAKPRWLCLDWRVDGDALGEHMRSIVISDNMATRACAACRAETHSILSSPESYAVDICRNACYNQATIALLGPHSQSNTSSPCSLSSLIPYSGPTVARRFLSAQGFSKPSTWSWLTWAGVVSLSFNIFWIIWTVVHQPVPTVFNQDWESLRSDGSACAGNRLRLTKGSAPKPQTQAPAPLRQRDRDYTDEFATAIATLGHSLNRVNTTARRLMLYIPEQVSPRALCIATATGFEAKPVQRIAPPNDGRDVFKHFVDQYTKLRLWQLDKDGARGVVYLDADTLATRNFDELFALPHSLAAVPDVYTNRKGFALQFNAGVLFLRPSTAVFWKIVETIPTAHYWRHEAEQALLNAFFAKDVVRLPYAYNANLAIKARSPRMWEGIKEEMRVIHYTMAKPFTGDNWRYVPMDQLEENARRRGRKESGRFAEEMDLWAQAWKEVYATYGEKLEGCMMLSNESGHQRQ
ncbi:hypothetical protein C8T65DRAFT_694919 [Cerioporus squamosus]|nr:hypothetical protein C8T65DRAFT_694919 [Cerioporus squamosus]